MNVAKKYQRHLMGNDALIQCLKTITKWKFATDGRKFNGDHKAVLKEVIEIAETALKQFKKGRS